MFTTYYYIDLYNKQNRPETEHEYFLRMASEQEQALLIAKRAARVKKVKQIFAKVLSLFNTMQYAKPGSQYGH
ncbi:hypothetical protein KDX31_12890 [Amphritea atlantica]|uniref:Transposase n=1 Tax=Amphritea atlantica TaxID=355243 RepID=A0ABY5GSI9_9GAMM|nr:hypothetical protein KDX31_12890 [Amphritea atlantica]